MRLAIGLLLLVQAGAAARAGIQGVVFTPGAEAPIALMNARVELERAQPGISAESPRVERTDAEGKFSFSGVAPGSYRIKVKRDGYLRKEYGEFALDEPGEPVSIRAGQRLDIRIGLDPAPGISGRISDEQGEGLPNVLVNAYRVTYDFVGARRLAPAFSAQTDDQGDYRLYWIDPGEYYVGATIVPDPIFDNPNEPPPPEGYAPTYFPGFTHPADGAPIRVSIGEEAKGTDFRLIRDPAFRERRVTLRGDVYLDRTAQLPGRSRITMEPYGVTAAAILRDESTEADGSFEIAGVDPGDYMLVAQAVRAGRAGGRETGFVRMTIRNRDVEGIRIVPTSGVRIEGVLTVEGSPGAFEDVREFRNARVELRSGLSPLPPAASGPPRPDGSFTVDRFYTGADYVLAVQDLPRNLYLKAARLSGMDILQTGAFHLDSQSPSDLLEITLGADGGSLKGSVYAQENDRPIPHARVVLAPEAKRRHRPDQYRTILTDDVGNFALKGIPPGTYSVFAWKHIETNAYLNAEVLPAYEGDARVIEIAPGENRPLGLRVLTNR
jgi:hypothetical protein